MAKGVASKRGSSGIWPSEFTMGRLCSLLTCDQRQVEVLCLGATVCELGILLTFRGDLSDQRHHVMGSTQPLTVGLPSKSCTVELKQAIHLKHVPLVQVRAGTPAKMSCIPRLSGPQGVHLVSL